MEFKAYENISDLEKDILKEKHNIKYINGVPEHTHHGFINYVEKGYPPGSFLRFCLTKDIYNAILNADRFNQKCIVEIVKFMCNNLPSGCWGNDEKVDTYIESFTRNKVSEKE